MSPPEFPTLAGVTHRQRSNATKTVATCAIPTRA